MTKKIIFLFLFVCLGLVSCGKKADLDLFENSITFNEDDSINVVMADSFEKDYYSVDALKGMIEDEISGKDISLLSVDYREDDKRISVVMRFNDITSYNDYSEDDIFYGTLGEAFIAGKLRNKIFREEKSNEAVSVDSDFVEKYSDYKIIIMKDNMNIHTYGEVLFTSGEANQKQIVIFK